MACYYQAINTFLDRDDRDTYDYVLLFEDDGVAFPDTKWPEDLEERVAEMQYQGAEMLLLGAHAVVGRKMRSLKGQELLYRAVDSSGAYAVMIRADTAQRMSDEISEVLLTKRDDKSAIDHELWKIYGRKGRISVPLLVDHRHGESNTWMGAKTRPSRDFEGMRDFWNFKD